MVLAIFRKMKASIRHRVENKQPGLYISILFPIVFVFTLTFIGSRIFSHLAPTFYFFEVEPGLRVHHFTYGFFILAASGYFALLFSGPRARYLIALFHGLGLGLAFDEFGMWLRLRDDDPARWSYDGLIMIISVFLLIISAKTGVRMLKILWPFRKNTGSIQT